MLAGLPRSDSSGKAVSAASAEAAAVAEMEGPGERTNTNLYLRAQMGLKAQTDEGEWGVRCSNFGDLPEELVDENESFHETLAQEAEIAREFSDALDDGGTIGPMVLWFGCDRRALSKEKMAGSSVPITDLILAAANGDTEVHPLPGMDYLALAAAARKFRDDPDQGIRRTIPQLDNLSRLAQEADSYWADEIEKAPDGYEYGALKTRRLVYGEDILWDARITTRWQDARHVFIFHTFTPEEAKTEDAFKPSARAKLEASPISAADGWESMASETATGDEIDALNKCVRIVECWDRDTGTLHYFTESGGYDGFLEKDPKYPYFDAHGKSVLKDWFPIRALVAVVDNLRIPERTLGHGWLSEGRDHALAYVAFDSRLTASRKKAGRIIELGAGVPDDVKEGIERGDDCTVVVRPAELDEKTPLVKIHTFGEAPFDFEAAKNASLQSFARCVDMTVEEISGVSIAPTLGQAEKAGQGAKTSRGGLIRKLERFAGECVRDLGALARLLYSDERVTALMGPKFTLRRPVYVMDQMGMPVLDMNGEPVVQKDPKTGEPMRFPSMWDLFKGSGFAGDKVEVTFGDLGQSLMERKSDDDFLALLATPAGMDPTTGLPYFDPRSIWARAFKSRRLGDPKPFPVPQMPPPQPQGQGEKPGGGENREAPGGGREDGRAARGMRGPPPVPGRQARGQGMGDVGDMGTKVGRTGVA